MLNVQGAVGISGNGCDTAFNDYCVHFLIIADGSDGSQWAYFSANKNATGLETGAGSFGFSISSTSVKDLSTTGTSAGWYQIKEAPEPTSGILMLIGLGALALRRRRA